jgi:uracil-DNA glycosylase family 4
MGEAARPETAEDPYGGDAATFAARLEAFTTLEALGAFARGCTRCPLRAGCRGVVFGEGDPAARLVLIGEGPGATEDELGRPFVGRAGALLDRILEAAGFRRQDVYISNVVLCRPPGNRTPTDEEIAACRPYLDRRLALLRPGIVVALGSTAVRALVDSRALITQVRGRWHRVDGRWVLPTFHPAAVLRDPSKKKPVWEDFQMVRELYRRLYGKLPAEAAGGA